MRLRRVRSKSFKQSSQRVERPSLSPDARWMMDLTVLVNQPVVVSGETPRYILVAVNVFDRYLCTWPLQTKEPREEKDALGRLLALALKKPKLISSDQGLEFKGVVSTYLTRKGIA